MILNAKETADLTAMLTDLTQEVQALRTEVGELRRAKAKGAELMDELGPIGLEMMAAATETFADLEQKGYFNFGRELLGVLDEVVGSYTAEDVKELGENVVGILDTVRTVTQPGVLAFAQQAGEAIDSADSSDAPVSVWEMMKASKDEDVQHGMAVMLSVVRQIGRTARGQAPTRRDAPKHPKYAKMAGRLASTRPRKKERLALPAPLSVNAPKPSLSAVNVEAMKRGPLPAPFDALESDANGHLLNSGDWSPEYAQAVATQAGLGPLTEEHFTVLNYARTSFVEKGKSPNVRALAVGSGLGTKAIYGLFPQKPGPTIARIAGIPKPVGCI